MSLCVDFVFVMVVFFCWMVFCLLIGGCNVLVGILYFYIGVDGICFVVYDYFFCVVVYVNEWNVDELLLDV